MTVDEMRELFAYDDWATGRLMEALERLTAEQSEKTVASSFPSLRETLAEIVVAEWFWLHRWLGENPTKPPAWASDGSLAELRQLGEAPPGTDLILYLRETA